MPASCSVRTSRSTPRPFAIVRTFGVRGLVARCGTRRSGCRDGPTPRVRCRRAPRTRCRRSGPCAPTTIFTPVSRTRSRNALPTCGTARVVVVEEPGRRRVRVHLPRRDGILRDQRVHRVELRIEVPERRECLTVHQDASVATQTVGRAARVVHRARSRSGRCCRTRGSRSRRRYEYRSAGTPPRDSARWRSTRGRRLHRMTPAGSRCRNCRWGSRGRTRESGSGDRRRTPRRPGRRSPRPGRRWSPREGSACRPACDRFARCARRSCTRRARRTLRRRPWTSAGNHASTSRRRRD